MSKHRGPSSWWWFAPVMAALGVTDLVLAIAAIWNARGR